MVVVHAIKWHDVPYFVWLFGVLIHQIADASFSDGTITYLCFSIWEQLNIGACTKTHVVSEWQMFAHRSSFCWLIGPFFLYFFRSVFI